MMIVLAATMLQTACSSDDERTDGDDLMVLTIDVVETDWTNETFNVSTRAGETIDGLKAIVDPANPADGEGFGIFSSALLGPTASTQRQVTWNAATGQWNAGQRIYWKRISTSDKFDLFAYAPYKSTPYTLDTSTGILTFPATDTDGKNTDLLYAGTKVDRIDGLAMLEFRHALAQISFGTITNNTGEAITLNSITLTGSLHQSGMLNLSTGEWSGQTAYDPASKTFTRTIDTDSGTEGNQPLAIANGAVKSLDIASFILIPGPTVTITLEIGRTTGTETFSFNTTLERGKNKTYNITVEKNFEVVIQ